VIGMAKSTSRLTVMDFIILVLTRHERELETNLDELEQITRKLGGDAKNEAKFSHPSPATPQT